MSEGNGKEQQLDKNGLYWPWSTWGNAHGSIESILQLSELVWKNFNAEDQKEDIGTQLLYLNRQLHFVIQLLAETALAANHTAAKTAGIDRNLRPSNGTTEKNGDLSDVDAAEMEALGLK